MRSFRRKINRIQVTLLHCLPILIDDRLAAIVISSYLPEILNLPDRILVAREGRTVEEFGPSEATEEKIMCATVY